MPEVTLSGKKQITIPAEACRKMNIVPGSKLIFLEFRPGEYQLVPKSSKTAKKSWAESLYGKYRQPGIDGVQSLLDDKKEDIILEERGYL